MPATSRRNPATAGDLPALPVPLAESAPAKINLTLRVYGARSDGYHDIQSLVAFADLCDRLTLVPGKPLALAVRGPFAKAAGKLAANTVLKAARLLASEIENIRLGAFALTKNIPVAAGLGGGSADAAAALRLLARVNRLKSDDPRLAKVARAVGADVPVCLDPQTRLMRGIGDILSDPLRIPKLHLVLVNPGKPLATARVFAAFEQRNSNAARARPHVPVIPQWRSAFIAMLEAERNDLEPAAVRLLPEIADALAALREQQDCQLARMSGSGPTCFGIFQTARAAATAVRKLKAAHRRWWVAAAERS
jgi:4-diphosphocytidyl-2-C-methyl-D-erythritol kinase